MYYIFEQELEAIGSANSQSAINLAFFGVALGAAISLWITLLTVEMKNPSVNAALCACGLVATVSAFYFGVRAFFDFRAAQRQVNAIRIANQCQDNKPLGTEI